MHWGLISYTFLQGCISVEETLKERDPQGKNIILLSLNGHYIQYTTCMRKNEQDGDINKLNRRGGSYTVHS